MNIAFAYKLQLQLMCILIGFGIEYLQESPRQI